MRAQRAIRSVLTSVLIVGALLVAITAPAGAINDGILDPTFNLSGTPPGTVVTPFGGGWDDGDVAVQPDGRVVVVGTSNGNFELVRYQANGSLDLSFDFDGIVDTDLGDLGGLDQAHALALQPDGKIIVVGSTDACIEEAVGEGSIASACYGGDVDIAIVRYRDDGSLDTSFGIGGVVTTDVDGGFDQAEGVTIQSDGQIVITGFAYVDHVVPDRVAPAQTSDADVVVARYNGSDGSPDGLFGGGGVTTTDLGGYEYGNDVEIQPDSNVVVVGHTDPGEGTEDAIVLRYDGTDGTDGMLDLSFDTDGIQTLDLGGDESFDAVALQFDGKIVAAGTDGADFLVARYTTSGALDDTTFNPLGIDPGTVPVNVGGPSDFATGVAVDIFGNIVVGGTADSTTYEGGGRSLRSRTLPTAVPDDSDFAIARLVQDGTPDPNFGTGGIVTTDIAGDDSAAGLALTPFTGAIVLGGSSGYGASAAAARYFGVTAGGGGDEGPGPGPSPSPSPGAGGDLSVLKTATPDPVTSTDSVLYSMTVTNGGPGEAGGATLVDTLPEGTTFVSVTTTGGDCAYDEATHTVSCSLGSIPDGVAVTIQILVKMPKVGEETAITNSVTSSSVGDPDPTNNGSEITTTILPKTDQNFATGYIAPEGGFITTDRGGGATQGDPETLAMTLGTQAGGSSLAAIEPAGGIATLIEEDCAGTDFQPCIGGIVGNFIPPEGFTGIRASITYDRSLTRSRKPRSIDVLYQKSDADPVIVLDRCGDPKVAPCVISIRRLKASGDIRVRVFLGADPHMGVR